MVTYDPFFEIWRLVLTCYLIYFKLTITPSTSSGG